MSRFTFGPRLSGFTFPVLPVLVPGEPGVKLDVEIAIAGCRVVDAVAIVDLTIPPHDAAATNYPTKVYTVFSPADPTEADKPEAWLTAPGNCTGSAVVPTSIDGAGTELSVAVPSVPTLGKWTLQVVNEWAA